MILPPSLPIHGPLHINNILQSPSHLDHPAPYHPRIYCYRFSNELLCGWRGVETHYEVVPAVVAHLVLFDGFGEKEGTPIRYAPDYAALGEDEGACCACDSRGREY